MKDVKIRKSKTDMREQARANNGRKHKKKRKKNRTFYYVLLLFFLIIVGTTLSVTVFFNIDEISVQGVSHYTYEDIVQAGNVSTGQNLLRLNTVKIEEDIIEQLQYCDKVTVKRNLPATLSIEVEEASPYMSIEYNGRYVHISRYGRILETDQSSPAEGSFQILGMDVTEYSKGDFLQKSDDEKQEILDSINDLLDKYEFSDITCVDITNTVDITVTYQDRINIRIGSVEELDYKVKAAKYLIDENLSAREEGDIEYVLDKRSTHFIPKQDLEKYSSGPTTSQPDLEVSSNTDSDGQNGDNTISSE